MGVVRSLADVGIPSMVVSVEAKCPTFWSRHCVGGAFMPNAQQQPEEAAEVLMRAAQRFPDRPVVLTGREPETVLISRKRELFSPYMRIKMAPADLIEALADKWKFADLAERHGLPVPRSFKPGNVDELAKLSETLSFPCLIKPLMQLLWRRDEVYAVVGRWRKAYLAGDREDLLRVFGKLWSVDTGLIVQEYIPGADRCLFDLHAYFDAPGHLAGYFLGRKIRTQPIHFGLGAYTRSWQDPGVARVGLEALERINYVGPANLNLKRDERTGRVALLEINPRFSLWCHLATRCGVNLPHALYNDCMGLPLPRLIQSQTERRWLYAYYDFLAFRQYRKTHEWNFLSWIGSMFFSRIIFYRWDWKDPLPLIRTFITQTGLHVKWFAQRFRRKRNEAP
ncbi:MAG: hypothetical protein V1798_04120 [Pseudomonadota bacterium]